MWLKADWSTQAPAGVLLEFDKKSQSYSLNLGYQWLPRLGLELGYLDLGNAGVNIKKRQPDASAIP